MTLEERFWSKVNKTAYCWLWTASIRNEKGYGQFRYNHKIQSAHRVSWQFHYGPIPEGIKVLHHCDNPPCVNPTHLFLGTHQDNVNDMMSKNRNGFIPPQGEKNGQHKLTENDVRFIRQSNLSGKELAKMFNVYYGYISRIKTRKCWKHTT